MTTRVKAVLIGIDSLISNISILNYQVWQAVLESYGYNLSYQEFLQFFLFEYGPHVLRNLFPISTLEEHEEIEKKKQAKFLEMIPQFKTEELHIPDGLHDFLNSIPADNSVIIAAVSDLSVDETMCLLKVLKLESICHVICSSYGLKRCRPDSVLYAVSLHKIGVTPECACVFEGTIEGCVAAKNAGIVNIIGVKPAIPQHMPNRELHRNDEVLSMINQGAQTVIDSFSNFKFDYISQMIAHRN